MRMLGGSLLAAAMLAGLAATANAQNQAGQPEIMPSGQYITPLAPTGAVFSKLNPGLKDFPGYTVGQAVKTAISPDGNTLLILTSGFNRLNDDQGHRADADSNEYVFVFDVTHGNLRQTQVLQVPNTFFGLAFAPDGNRFYVSGGVDDNVHVFARAHGVWAESGAPVTLGHKSGAGFHQRPMVANLAVTADGRILVAADIADDALSIVDLDIGAKVGELDLRAGNIHAPRAGEDSILTADENGAVSQGGDSDRSAAAHGESPFGVAIEGTATAYVSSERDREIDVIDIAQPAAPTVKARIPVAGNPNNLLLNRAETRLYVAADNSDRISVIDTATNRVIEEIRTTAPAGVLRGPAHLPGAAPNSLTLSPDEKTLYVTNGGMNAIAVIAIAPGAPHRVVGLIPTGWYPQSISVAHDGKTLYDVNSKSAPGPNPQRGGVSVPAARFLAHEAANQYILQLEKAGLQAIPVPNRQELAWLTKKVAANDFLDTVPNPQDEQTMAALRRHIKHVIYIIKENRTYDQVLGDLQQDGKPVGNGDPSLTMYGAAVTPNIHKLALQFGVLDNFFDSGEVSGDGHVWSNAAIGSEYLEKTWQQSYRGDQRFYDFEGVVAAGYPLLQRIPDVNEPQSGYLWGDLAAHGKTYYHFGEFISTVFCDQAAASDPQLGPMLQGRPCARKAVAPGENLPPEWGGGVNKWPWPIPLISANTATKPQLVGHFAEEAPDFNLAVPDQIRVDIFMRHLQGWVADKQQGKDTMPNFVMLRIPNDHTAGTRPGGPTPKASVADNDLAVGRAVEAISHSPFWDDTAFFILEDDAQDGADHVDAHRSYALVISKYAPHGANGAPFVDSRFYSTVSVVRTMESLLGLPPMNNNDAFSSLISSEFTGPGDQAPFVADTSNRDNNLIYTANAKRAPGASESMKMDFRHADRADAQTLNVILWKDAMGSEPVPAMLTQHKAKRRKDDDD